MGRPDLRFSNLLWNRLQGNRKLCHSLLLDPQFYKMNNSVLGYIGVAVAVLFFGSNFIPIKKYETGDGVFFQFVVCMGMIHWLLRKQ